MGWLNILYLGWSPGLYVFLALISLIIVTAIIILGLIERKMSNKIDVKVKFEAEKYTGGITAIRSSDMTPQEAVRKMHPLVRSYLEDCFQIKKTVDYSEISSKFSQEDPSISQLANQMILALYSGEKVSQDQVVSLLDLFEEIINKNGKNNKSKNKSSKNQKNTQPVNSKENVIIPKENNISNQQNQIQIQTPQQEKPEPIKENNNPEEKTQTPLNPVIYEEETNDYQNSNYPGANYQEGSLQQQELKNKIDKFDNIDRIKDKINERKVQRNY